ncbi:heat-inducible transcriptional repressor HrcA [Oceanivirga salmonicida]|uniref:heat-inducible transcriptional repressor HrcA n=1 Tax=Oceanivirga salmonicida TaxID=1769291 RepID=UPI00083756F2|nr:heat-inducible transcriptional repressor HrcA [Oceanivirga salmonicida]
MNEREKQILYTIISHYIKTGESVGSRTIEKKYDIGVSSATIRNAMADLEDKGLISKVHTSSGRVPTQDGYKMYIDELMYTIEKEHSDEDVNSYIELKTKQLGIIIKKITELIAKSSNNTAVSLEPSVEKHKLKKVELVYVNPKRTFVVAVTDLGIVKTANLNLSNYTTENTLKDLSHYINKLITDNMYTYTLLELKEVLNKIGYLDEGFSNQNILKLHIANETSLLLHLDNLVTGIKFIEDKTTLKGILKDIVENKNFKPYEINVMFGSDLGLEELKNLSFIFSIYEYENERGVISIIGSERMNYKENISLLNYANDILKQSLLDTYNIKLLR